MQEQNPCDTNFLSRFELAMRKRGLRDVDLFREHKIAQSTVSRWRAGAVPRTATLNALADAMGVRRAWLKDGEGEMDSPNTRKVMTDPDTYYTPNRSGLIVDILLDATPVEKIQELIAENCKAITELAATGERPNDEKMDAMRTLWEALADRSKPAA